ncbi:MAG TPA: monovalent cation/H+ antiporter subunit D family protein [Arenicellales bacterium]|nr:monovalent cation/H+ antiporter subunit D family protein [Arenicellales bacterium]
MSLETHLLLCTLVPLLGAAGIVAADSRPNLREAVTLSTAVVLFALVLALPLRDEPYFQTAHYLEVLPSLSIALSLEPLGLLFATVASGLWIVTSVYAIGYMRGNDEKHQTRFYCFFAISIAAAQGIALSDNLFTLFIFYEVLTLCTYPLVTHKGNDDARRGGRVYLGVLLTTSIGFFLVAMIWTWQITGSLDFVSGGLLSNRIEGGAMVALLALFLFGIGKAALMPFHRWLPAAMVAPTPVSALLHAVAVVKAGVFTVLKVTVYTFGLDSLFQSDAATVMMWVAAATLLMASITAVRKDNLKARLAYSTVSQLAYVTLGAMLATSMGIVGGAFQIAAHALAKITLFFCAGAIYTAAHKTEVSELDGLGRKMPFTFAAFFIASLSIIGIPPLGGSWSKWYLMMGAVDAGHWTMIVVLMISSLLTIAYLVPVTVRGFFGAPGDRGFSWREVHEAPASCVVPLCFTALACVALFFFGDGLYALVLPVVAGQ